MYLQYQQHQARAKEIELKHRHRKTVETALLEGRLPAQRGVLAIIRGVRALFSHRVQAETQVAGPRETGEVRAASL